ncbi:MAG: type 4a pilus biogenesis protein PilO [Actinomycetota bacterium]
MLVSKRGPLIAGVVAGALILMMIFFLVLPKLHSVSSAQSDLSDAQAQQQTLEGQKAALEDVKASAPDNKAVIASVDSQIPPLADESGMILLLQNAATSAGLDLVTITPSTPTFDATTGLSTITVSVSASGTYFDVTEFMYRIETLPRAAKVTGISLAPGSTSTTTTTTSTIPTLTLSATVDMYTSDASAGPGSIPGPTTPSEAGA